jgi:GT2 family glycosyltransferase/glycosyltransferase involved in cell wall biosynthesis
MKDNAPPAAKAASAHLCAVLGGFFDTDWYRHRYPDIDGAVDPLTHFVERGIVEGRDPNRFFDGAWYSTTYPDVAASGCNPLLHFLQYGQTELRNPHPRFDTAWYVEQHPEAAANPLFFHIRVGAAHGWATEPTIDIGDYLPSTGTSPAPPADIAVDVVIPVYRGRVETKRCLDSVLADTARPAGRVIVVDDQSPEPALTALLDRLAASGRIVLLRNQDNLGFVASVNRGIEAAGAHDVALLNSDTEVPQGWLARLAGHAYAAPRIASVSPFSNNATICSYPGNAGGPPPFGLRPAALDDAARAANAGRFVELPTTVGFCMYIRRAALAEIGRFDEQAFGKGYGEENDFCLRAAARGWRHLLACDILVVHKGAVSFGADAANRQRAAMVALTARHPAYQRSVADFVRLDPVGRFRFALTAALFRRSGLPTVLMVTHGLGGGIGRHVGSLVRRLAGVANCLMLDSGSRGATLSVPALAGHPTLSLPGERVDDLVSLLRSCNVARVHIHHAMGLEGLLRDMVHALGVPFDLTVHDYYALCPQVTMLPWLDSYYCGEPGPGGCNACIGDRPSHAARDILSWRRSHVWQFLEAERVICPSEDVRARLERYGFGHRAVVAPHEAVAEGPWPLVLPRLRGRRLRVAVLGVLAEQKGAQAVIALAEAADPSIEIVLVGYPERPLPEPAAHFIRVTGEYAEADLPRLLAKAAPHVVWFPSQAPETYSYTLTAALDAGLPVVASAIGAFPERLAGRPLTWLVDPKAGKEAWLAAFALVRQALACPAPDAGQRAAVPDFYAEHYPRPLTRYWSPDDGPGGCPGGGPSRESSGEPEKPSGERHGASVHPGHRPADAPADRRKARSPVGWAQARPAGRNAGDALIDLRRNGRTSLVVVPERFGNGAFSPCAYIRLLLPLDHPAIGGDWDIVLADPRQALHYRADIIATQRYAVPDPAAAEALARHCRATGARLVYDLDDDLLHIPREHPEAALLRPRAKTVAYLVQSADTLFVSTAALAARLAAIRPDAVVVPNALDERLWLPPPRGPIARGPVRLLCMGTATHDADLAVVVPALERLADRFGDRVTIDVLGVTARGDLPPWANRPAMTVNAVGSYPGFVNWITGQPAWDIGITPLADTPFNRCKSAIKTLDYAALGLPVLASDIAPYRGSLADHGGGMLIPNDTTAWLAALSRLIRDPELRAQLAAGARAALATTGTLASQAAARREAWLGILRDRESGGESAQDSATTTRGTETADSAPLVSVTRATSRRS